MGQQIPVVAAGIFKRLGQLGNPVDGHRPEGIAADVSKETPHPFLFTLASKPAQVERRPGPAKVCTSR